MAIERAELLDGIRVVDLAVGMAGALTGKFLAEFGAQVTRVPPAQGDPSADRYPAYAAWRHRAVVDTAAAHSDALLTALLAQADVCLLGGEDFPGFEHRGDAHVMAERHPQLIVLTLTGAPAVPGQAVLPAVELLAQARSGLVHEQFTQRPYLHAFQPASYGSVLQALSGVAAALYERERSGRGGIVGVSMLEGAMTYLQAFHYWAEKPSRASSFLPPKDPRPIVMRCRDGAYIHVVLGAIGSKYKLYKILGIDDPSIKENDPGLPDLSKPVDQFYGDIDLLADYFQRQDCAELVERLSEAGVVCSPVVSAAQSWDNPQIRHNGIVASTPEGVRYIGAPASWRGTAAPRRPLPTGALPLAGLRVIDFGAFVAGPMASVGLADLGADVIKVEPLEGDPMRGTHGYFCAVNRGKRSLAIDLKKPQGLAIAHALCADADVVCSNFKAGVAARLGIDAATLHRQRPQTIVLNNAGYGTDGPYVSRPAFDPAMQAATGHEIRGGGRGNDPLINRTMMVDFSGGLLGNVMATFALYRRACSGQGADITVALIDAASFLNAELIQLADGSFAGCEPLDADRTGFHPAEKIYACSDGWLAVCVRGEAAARGFAEALQLDALPAFALWGDGEAALIAQALHALTLAEATAALTAAGVWVEPCNGEAIALLHDAALVASGHVYRSAHPTLGETRGIGVLKRFSGIAAVPAGDSPLLGGHSDAILRELGHDDAAIAALRESGVIR